MKQIKQIRILLTGAGYLGANIMIRKVKELDKRFCFIGIDINPNSAAQIYCDKFYLQKDFDLALEKEKPDLILPGTSEFIPINTRIGKTMASNPDTISTCLSKVKTYEKLKNIIPLPQYINSLSGYYYKIDIGKGGRGINYLSGDSRFIMETLEGEQIDADVLSWKGKLLIAMLKRRERTYGGNMIEGEIVNRPEIISQIQKALKVLPLSYLSVWQFIGEKLIEINPRLAGTMFYPQGWNMPYLAIKLALGEMDLKEIKQYQNKVSSLIGKRIARCIEQYQY